MSPVMKLPGMYPRPCPANTAPPTRINKPATLTAALTNLGYRAGLPHPAVDDGFLFGVLQERFDPVLFPEP